MADKNGKTVEELGREQLEAEERFHMKSKEYRKLVEEAEKVLPPDDDLEVNAEKDDIEGEGSHYETRRDYNVRLKMARNERVAEQIVDKVNEERKEKGMEPLKKEGPLAFLTHPKDLSEHELKVLVAGIMSHIPLYVIANKLRVSRNYLSTKIQEVPELTQIWNDSKEAFIDNAEFQAKRLIDSGNPAMIMFALERQGRNRGWGQNPVVQAGAENDKIFIGAIPEEEVANADAFVERQNAQVGLTEQMKLGMDIPQAVEEDDGMEIETDHERVDVEPVRYVRTSPAPYVAQHGGQTVEEEVEGAGEMPEDGVGGVDYAMVTNGEVVTEEDAEEAMEARAPWDGGDGFGGGGFGFM